MQLSRNFVAVTALSRPDTPFMRVTDVAVSAGMTGDDTNNQLNILDHLPARAHAREGCHVC